MKALRFAVWTAVAMTLAAVFGAYLQPDMAIYLQSRFWGCFGG